MKKLKILLVLLGGAIVMNLSASADDLKLVQIFNGHGQSFFVYRYAEPTIAVYADMGVGTADTSYDRLHLVWRDNGHGERTLVYRQLPQSE